MLECLYRVIPGFTWHYLADTAYVPYGDKPVEVVIERTEAAVRYALAHNAQAFVIACNTATAAAAALVRERYPQLPVIGIEPAVKPATFHTKTGVVGILATTNTLSSEKFKTLVQRYAGQATVLVQPCPGLVECIESGDVDSAQVHQLLGGYLNQLVAQGADVLVLGCTHYPFLTPLIRILTSPQMVILDAGEPVARETRRRLGLPDDPMMTPRTSGILQSPSTVVLRASGPVDHLQRLASQLIPNIPVHQVLGWSDPN